ncbi:hypothetical protein VTI74DRAFT_10575 [Chaetomium olivicolor]
MLGSNKLLPWEETRKEHPLTTVNCRLQLVLGSADEWPTPNAAQAQSATARHDERRAVRILTPGTRKQKREEAQTRIAGILWSSSSCLFTTTKSIVYCVVRSIQASVLAGSLNGLSLAGIFPCCHPKTPRPWRLETRGERKKKQNAMDQSFPTYP